LGSGGGAARQHQSLRQFSLGLLLAHRALYLIARSARCDVRLVAAVSSEPTERRSVVPPSPPQIGGANIGDPPTSSPSSPLGLVLASLAPLLEHGGRAIPDTAAFRIGLVTVSANGRQRQGQRGRWEHDDHVSCRASR
jgi:hypothetical protein